MNTVAPASTRGTWSALGSPVSTMRSSSGLSSLRRARGSGRPFVPHMTVSAASTPSRASRICAGGYHPPQVQRERLRRQFLRVVVAPDRTGAAFGPSAAVHQLADELQPVGADVAVPPPPLHVLPGAHRVGDGVQHMIAGVCDAEGERCAVAADHSPGEDQVAEERCA